MVKLLPLPDKQFCASLSDGSPRAGVVVDVVIVATVKLFPKFVVGEYCGSDSPRHENIRCDLLERPD